MKRVAINGFGRIGRAFFKASLDSSEVEVVAVNDLGEVDNLAYLLTYDTTHGTRTHTISADNGALVVDGKRIPCSSIRDPKELPWGTYNVDVVVESTGVFASYQKSYAHVEAGAKKVVITAPVKDTPREGVTAATVLVGVNEEKAKVCTLTSNASCTTNAISSPIQVLDDAIGVEKAILNTIHAYTASQSVVDGPAKNKRLGRAAAQNIIPSTTGAAIATTLVLPSLTNKFDGVSLRVPVVSGSIADLTFIAKRKTTPEEINNVFTQASKTKTYKGILEVTDKPLVSSDIIGLPYAALVDLQSTRVVDGTLCKALIWYDNEMGYAHTLIRHIQAL